MSIGVPNITPPSVHNPATDPNESSSSSDGASQLRGHAKWVKGVGEETIGNLTGSPVWKASGAHDKHEGIAMMRAAKERVDRQKHRSEYPRRRSASLGAEGKTEGIIGRVVGCAGMEERGTEKCQLAERKRSLDNQ